MNTYMRVGKLFPGPHLYAGMGITALWAAAAALVPYMQKGNQLARNTHIALNCVNLGLFAWQLPTGWEIVRTCTAAPLASPRHPGCVAASGRPARFPALRPLPAPRS